MTFPCGKLSFYPVKATAAATAVHPAPILVKHKSVLWKQFCWYATDVRTVNMHEQVDMFKIILLCHCFESSVYACMSEFLLLLFSWLQNNKYLNMLKYWLSLHCLQKLDPTQFLRVYGRPYKVNYDPAVALAAESPQSM